MMVNLFSIFDPSSSYMKLVWLTGSAPLFTMIFSFLKSNLVSKAIHFVVSLLFTDSRQMMGLKMSSYCFLFSIFVVVAQYNLYSLVPLIFPVSSHMSLVLPLGLTFWVTPFLLGWIVSLFSSVKSLLPQGTPYFLMPLMIVIEGASLLIRPITLSVRLVANITAGHLLLSILVNFIMKSSLGSLNMLVLLLMNSLEVGVALIQSYVFLMLVVMYTTEV